MTFETVVKETVVWTFPVQADCTGEAHRKADAALHGDDGKEPVTYASPLSRILSRDLDFATA